MFGGIERDTGKCFLVEVPDRTRATLEPIVLQLILPGSHIISDPIIFVHYSCNLSPDSLADRNVAVAALVQSHHVTHGCGNYIFTDRFSIVTLYKFQLLQLLFGKTEGTQVHSSGKKKVWVFSIE